MGFKIIDVNYLKLPFDTIFYQKSLEVTLTQHFVSLRTRPVLLLDTIFYRKSFEVTSMQHFVSSSDGETVVKPLYRELD